jgi:hypothetical protein
MNKRTNYRTSKITKCQKVQNVEKQDIENTKRRTVMGGMVEGLVWPMGQTQPSTVPS